MIPLKLELLVLYTLASEVRITCTLSQNASAYKKNSLYHDVPRYTPGTQADSSIELFVSAKSSTMLTPFTERHRNTNYITSARFVNVFYHSSSTYTIIPCLSLNLRRSTAIIDHHLLSLLDASKIPLATCNLSVVPVHLCQVK